MESAAYSYSYLGKNPWAQTFRLPPIDYRHYLNDKLDHMIETGTMLILKSNTSNKVLAATGMLDFLDMTWTKTNSNLSSYSKN